MNALLPSHSRFVAGARSGERIENIRTKVLIVENHELVRKGLAAVVNSEGDMETCGEVPCTEAALQAVRTLAPEVVLIDVSLARGPGLELIQQIRRHDPAIRIIALAMSDKPALAERIFDAGAAALVMKTDLAARVLETIRRKRLDAAATRGPRNGVKVTGTTGARGERCLDAIEREIVEMIGHGVPTRAIAVKLGLSVQMVDACRRRIRAKLNCPTATQLVQFCVRWVQREREEPGEE